MPGLQAPEVQYLSLGRAEFPFVEYGEPDERPPLILLHGISMPPTHWGQFPEKLGRYTIALGLPAGKQAPLIPTLDGYARKMIPAIHELAGDTYDVLGLSWGGLLAQEIALDDRKHVRGMVLAATRLASPLAYVGMPDPEAMKVLCSRDRSPEHVGLLYGGDLHDNPALLAKHSSLIDREINKKDHARQLFAAVIAGPLLTRRLLPWNWDGPETMMLAGDDDPIVPYIGAMLGAAALGIKLVTMPGGGHGFIITRPQGSAEPVREFLEELDSSQRPNKLAMAA